MCRRIDCIFEYRLKIKVYLLNLINSFNRFKFLRKYLIIKFIIRSYNQF